MEEEQAARLSQMEQSQEEIRGQLARMMEMMSTIIERQAASGPERRQTPEAENPTQNFQQGHQVPTPSIGVERPQVNVNPPTASQNSGAQAPNMAFQQTNPIIHPNLGDPMITETPNCKSPVSIEDDRTRQAFELLEERMRAIEGVDLYGALESAKLNLVPGLIIPPKFKAPDFEKYDGKSCPVAHITMYYRKMAAHAKDDKLMIYTFQDSLSGSALRWYNQLEGGRIHSWKDLARGFIAQYKHSTDLIPDRMSLQKMEQKSDETFRQYAQRWRDEASQVEPPLTDREITMMFIETLKDPYYRMMAGNASKDFADLVVSGETIEQGVKLGRIEAGGSSGLRKGVYPKKKEEVQAINWNGPPRRGYVERNPTVGNVANRPAFKVSVNPPVRAPPAPPARQVQPHGEQGNRRWGREEMNFPPIPISYSDLFDQLVEARILAPVYLEPLKPPFPAWYDPNVNCKYHYNLPGHATEKCKVLKQQVHRLIQAGIINFNEQPEPNVEKNPLPEHAKPNVSVIGEDVTIKGEVGEVKMSMEKIYRVLEKMKMVAVRESISQEEICLYHGSKINHSIESCVEFKMLVQEMMNESRMIFFEKQPAMSVNMVDKPSFKPFTVYCKASENAEGMTDVNKPMITINVPKPFPYKDNKAVPWKYGVTVSPAITSDATNAADITGLGGVTRSGRIYAPPITKKGQCSGTKEDVGKDQQRKQAEPYTEEEAEEFLKFVKHSEYSIVDQLSRTPAKITLLSLLLNSESHRNALLKALNQAYVEPDISVDKVDRLVGNITASNFLSFSDDEIPPEGRGHVKALHITTYYKEFSLGNVLVDNGSSINVMPLNTLKRLFVDLSYMRNSGLVIKAFDGSTRVAVGEVDLPLQIGPVTFDIHFQVMDIRPGYTYLLGRPWIHVAGAVPSSLHQKVKFIVENKLVTIFGEQDILVTQSSDAPCITVEETLEDSFRSFEIVDATFVGEGTLLPEPKLPKSTVMSLNAVLGKGARTGYGLGIHLQGITQPITLRKNDGTFGLGFRPSWKDRQEAREKGRMRRMARLRGEEEPFSKLTIPHISKSFVSKGFQIAEVVEDLSNLSINVIEDEKRIQVCADKWIYKTSLGAVEKWTIEELPIVYK